MAACSVPWASRREHKSAWFYRAVGAANSTVWMRKKTGFDPVFLSRWDF